jgi:hypothetical protein
MSQSIKIAFTDFWHGNSLTEVVANPLYQILSRQYDLELSNSPDFLIYSCFGQKYLKYDCTRIFFTGENVRPDFNRCDYAFSFDYPVTDRNYRLPLYYLYDYFDQLRDKIQRVPDHSAKKFCNFVYSNRKARERIEFYEKLTSYKPIDSGGKVMNNVGGRVGDKLEFLRNYKFTITFENSSHPGYTTEKIMEALIAGTIPIYWGNPLVTRDFNSDCFINCHDFESFDEVIAHVEKVDNDDELYRRYLTAPAFINGVDNEFVNEINLKRQFDKIFSGTTRSQVAGRYDLIKYWLHPSRPESFTRSLARRWRKRFREARN